MMPKTVQASCITGGCSVRDAKGTLMPNTWYATEDIGNTEGGSKNYDGLFARNAKPESAALDPSVPGLPGEPGLVFDFNQTYAGSLNDKMGDYWLYPTQQERPSRAKCPTPKLLDINTGGAVRSRLLQLQVATLVATIRS